MLAIGQDVENDPAVISSADVPVASDAIPDWYQRFSTADLQNGIEDWTGQVENDVQFNLTPSARWNLQLGLTSRDNQVGLPREEMWAGATFNITPRLSFGGSVIVGSDELGPNAKWGDQELEAGIKLQSAFKF